MFNKGDRVVTTDGRNGIVRQVEEQGVLVYWGFDRNHEHTSYVVPEELALLDEPVYYGDPETGKKDKVWEGRNAGPARSEETGASPEAAGETGREEEERDTEAPPAGEVAP